MQAENDPHPLWYSAMGWGWVRRQNNTESRMRNTTFCGLSPDCHTQCETPCVVFSRGDGVAGVPGAASLRAGRRGAWGTRMPRAARDACVSPSAAVRDVPLGRGALEPLSLPAQLREVRQWFQSQR